MNRKEILIITILGLLVLFSYLVVVVHADSNPAIQCDWISYSHEACVATQVVYNQTQILIQLEQQNIKLTALSICEPNSNRHGLWTIHYPNGDIGGDYLGIENKTQCINRVLNETK